MYTCPFNILAVWIIILYVNFPVAVVQDLISSGQLAGSLRGRMDKAVYIPNIYTQMQSAWTDSFLASNGYLGINYIHRSSDNVVFLSTCL